MVNSVECFRYIEKTLKENLFWFMASLILVCISIRAMWDVMAPVGRDGALVESIAFNRRVVGSTPALAAM